MGLRVIYRDKKIEKVCTDLHEAEKRHGTELALKIHQRIDQIKAAESVDELVQWHIGKCHLLTGDRKEQYAMFLSKNWRLIFEKVDNEIKVVRIIEVTDYH